jgi:PAS domain S-box-containing protein
MALVAADGTMLEVNDAFAAMLGYDVDELRGRSYAAITHPDDLEGDLALAGELFRGERTTYQLEKRYVRKDGDVAWGRLTGSVIPDPDDGPGLALGLVEDITDRKRAEEARDAAEERFRALVETIPAVTYVWQSTINTDVVEAHVTYTSPQILALLGYTAEEWEADPMMWEQRLHPDDREAVLARTEASERDGAPFEMEYRYLAKDGSVVWVRDSAVLLDRTPDGRPWRFQGVMMDVTDRKLVEESLAETSERLNAIVDGSPLAIVTMDLHGIVKTWNPAAEQMFGWTADEAVGHFLPPVGVDRRSEFEHLRDRVLGSAGVAHNTTVQWRKDGAPLDVALSTGPLHDRFGKVVGLIAVLADVTETREAQRRLAEAERRYRTLVERLPAITYLDRVEAVEDRVRYDTVYVSPQIESILGYPADRWGGEIGWVDCLHPDDRERVLALTVECVAGERPLEAEYRLLAADGHVVWIREQSAPLREGGALHWQGVMYDVTATKEAELALRAAEERYRVLVEQIPAVTFTDDSPAHEHLYVSPQIRDLIGVDAEAAMADHELFRRHVHPDDDARVWEAWDEALAAGRPFEAEYRVVHQDGTVKWVWERSAVTGGDNPVVQGVLFDVTDRKQAEEVVRASEAEVRGSLEVLRRTDAERRELLRHLVAIETAERGRLAEGIEDRSIQDFAAVGLRLEMLRRNLEDPDQRGAIDRLSETVQQALDRLRHLLVELRPRELESQGLAAALERYAGTAAPGAVRVSVRNRLVAEPDPGVRALAYRVAQDALAHAFQGAADGAELVVEVEGSDDGFVVRVGVDGADLSTAPGHDDAVRSLRERAAAAGGWIRTGHDGSIELWFPGRLRGAD